MSVSLLVLLLATRLPAQSISRTLVYHQITNFSAAQGFNSDGLQAPILSRNGARIAFSRGFGTGDPATPNRIFVINPDGTGEQQVDAYTSLVFSGSFFDISDDGTKVVSTESVQLRISDSGGARALIAFDSNEINGLKISGDGTKVFFRVGRDTSVRGTSPAVLIPRGIYVINADGTGLRLIVGVTQLAAALGVQATDISLFQGTFGLDASTNGSRVVFSTLVAPEAGGFGQGLFGVNLDGSGLHSLLGRVGFVQQGAISADGTKVGYNFIALDNSAVEVGVLNFDGSGRLKLTDNTVEHGGTGRELPNELERLQLTADGSWLLIGGNGLLYKTDGSATLQLNASVPDDSNIGLSQLLSESLTRATMNADATRFLYISYSPLQLNLLEVNPASVGAAPAISNPSLSPTFILLNGGSSATVKASLTPANPAVFVLRYFINGFEDISFYRDNNNDFRRLHDDGKDGDATAGDGVFTNNAVDSSTPLLGQRTPRLIAGLKTSDGRFQAEAVEFAPFSVLDQPPADSKPPTITITSPPANIQVVSGSPVPLAASVDDPAGLLKQVRFFLNGVLQSSSTSSGPFILNATAPAPGTYTLTATAIDTFDRQSSSTRIVTVVAPDPDSPTPSTTVLTPLDGRILAAGSTITLSAIASALAPGEELAQVDFYADGVIFASFGGAGNPLTSGQSNAERPTRRDSPVANGTVYQAKYTLPPTSKLVSLFTVAVSKLGRSQVSAPVTVQSVANVADRPPQVALGGLTNRQRVRAGVTVPVSLSVSDPDPASANAASGRTRPVRRVFEASGVISRVEFFVNQLKVKEEAKASVGFDFSPDSAGTYVLTAVATDGAGLSTVSDPITVTVAPTVSLKVQGNGIGQEGAKNAKVLFSRTGDTDSALKVFFKLKGSAVNGVDYEKLKSKIVIPAGETSFKLKIKPIDNHTAQGTRKVTVQLLESPTDDYDLGDAVKAKVSLLDND